VWYSAVAVGGVLYASSISTANDLAEREKERREEAKERGDDPDENGLDQKDIAERKTTLGLLLYQGAGGMSAYHTFRTAARTRQEHGQYEFLQADDTPADLLAAPFHFSYLTRVTTIIPLAVIAGISALQLSTPLEDDSDYERASFTQADAFFSGAFSYNAGTHEEAVFRGWIMPVMREYWDSDFWSNAAQSVLFAAAHLSTNPQPLPQLLLGYHLGYVTQRNHWSLGESVFIHTWWDVMAFVTQYHYKQRAPEDKKDLIKPILWLPPLEFAF
jgi:membrane protease YdiL (CAAX protease family)